MSGHAVAMGAMQITACMADTAFVSCESLAKVSSVSWIGWDLYVPAAVTTYVEDCSRLCSILGGKCDSSVVACNVSDCLHTDC